MEFRILGPVEAIEQERSLPLGAYKQRALLALLLVHGSEAVSADRLIDELWGEEPPPTAAKSLQVYVSQLRKALGEGVLETRGRSYVLEVAPGQLDARRFEDLLERGREQLATGDPSAAAATLEDALGLWRGPPLDEFAFEDFAQPEIARLGELRQAAVEGRIDAELALGHSAELLPELESLVSSHPLRERLRGQLMLALYRSGRQADALAAYQNARRALADDLGLEPSRELQELERAILNHDPQLDAPARAARAGRGPWRRRIQAFVIAGVCVLAAAIVAVAVALTRGDGGSIPGVAVERNSLAVIDVETNRVVAGIPVGDGPTSIAVAAGNVWVVNRDAQTISWIDSETRALVKTFAIGLTPAAVAAGPERVWVGDSVTHSVVELDPESGGVLRTIAAPPLTPPPVRSGTPLGGAIVVDPEAVWFSSGNATLSRIDQATGEVEARIRHGGATSEAPTLAVGEGAVWVSACCEGVMRVDPRTNETAAGIAVSDGPIAAGLGSVWIADTFSGLLWQLDPDPLMGPLNLPVRSIRIAPGPLAVTVGAGSVWVAGGDGTVSRVNPTTAEVQSIRVGGSLTGIAFGEGAVWVSVN